MPFIFWTTQGRVKASKATHLTLCPALKSNTKNWFKEREMKTKDNKMMESNCACILWSVFLNDNDLKRKKKWHVT